MLDRYYTFTELANCEVHGRDYDVRSITRPSSRVLVVAPHGGSIEVGTSEIAALIAGDEHNLFTFDGLKPMGRNRTLHITSHRFDHPACLALAARCALTIGVHGCRGSEHVYLGGLDSDLSERIGLALHAAGIAASTEGHKYPGRNPLNICNRGTRGRGVQIEVTHDLRMSVEARTLVARAVRDAVADYLPSLG